MMRRECLEVIDLLAPRKAPVTREQASRLAAHLATCERCRQVATDQEWAHARLAELPVLSPDCQKAVEAVRARIAAQGGPSVRTWVPRLVAAVAVVVVVVAAGAVLLRSRPVGAPEPSVHSSVANASGGPTLAAPSAGTARLKPLPEQPRGTLAARVVVLPRRRSAHARRHSGTASANTTEPSRPMLPATAEGRPELMRFFLLPPPEDPAASVSVVAPGDGPARPAPSPELLAAEMWERIALAQEAAQDEPRQTEQEPSCPGPPPYEAKPAGSSHSEAAGKGGWS